MIFWSLLADSSRKKKSSFLDFDFRPLGGHFVTDQIFVFFHVFSVCARVFGASPGVWMLYQVCGCFTRSVDALPGVIWACWVPREALRRHGRGTAGLKNCLSRTWPWHGRRMAPEKTVVHRPALVGQVGQAVMVVRYQIQIPRFMRESQEIDISRLQVL